MYQHLSSLKSHRQLKFEGATQKSLTMMNQKLLAIAIILCTLHAVCVEGKPKKKLAFVKKDATSANGFKILKFNPLGTNVGDIRLSKDAIVWGLYENKINETGWGFLELQSNSDYPDDDQAYAAGLLEGYLTNDLIYMHWYNTVKDFCLDKQPVCTKIKEYIKTNQDWITHMIATSSSNDEYWYQVRLFYKQLEGLAAGYSEANKIADQALTYSDLLWLNLDGDLEDLSSAFEEPTDLLSTGTKVLGSGSCSALIKMLPDSSDIFVSHVTWSGYNTMLRLQKKYVLPFRKSENSVHIIPGKAMSFSSFPGGIQSGDDFFLISSGLVTLETTIGNSNASRWAFIKPEGQVLEVVRTMVANRLAVDGRSWSTTFTAFNSGTYNNQWMIVDYNKFKPGTAHADLPDDLLWVLEQIPGLIVSDDVTKVLRQQSYWPSYNTPYFKEIFDQSGQQAFVDKFGDWFTYDRTPRARIFRRDHVKVRDATSMMALMRYNDYRNDPLSRCNCTPPYSAENAISARCDMNPANGTYPFGALGHRSHGATDAKITSRAMFNQLEMIAVSGPVFNAYMPPFQWSKTDFGATLAHIGHPDFWRFSPVIHHWSFAGI